MSLLGWELCSIGLASVCTLAVGAPAQLSLGYVCPCPTCPRDRFRCRVLSLVQTLAVGALLNCRLGLVSCGLGKWELCSIVASVLCRVGPWRWELCSIVALVDLVVIPTRTDACSRLDQKIFRRLSEQLLGSLRQLLGGKMAISMTAPVAEAQVAAKVCEPSPLRGRLIWVTRCSTPLLP